ncbi:MAG: FAD-dependent oxidoreductase [Vulcanimicrobiaceae bacterium]
MTTEIAIVGAGPGGLAAAAAVARAGARVLIIDAYARAGGQYDKQPYDTLRQSPHGLYKTQVWRIDRGRNGFRLHAIRDGAPIEIDASAVILAPGAYERVLPFPGWQLPGVMTPGAAQTLVKEQRTIPGKRIIIAGSGPFLLPVALTLVKAGADVAGVFEAAHTSKLWRVIPALARMPERASQTAQYVRALRAARVPVHYGYAVIEAAGKGRVEYARIARLDHAWRPIEGGERILETDTICAGFGFMPQTDLADGLGCERYRADDWSFVACDEYSQTSISGVFAAGEITGIRGADAAIAQGEIAGIRAAQWCGKIPKGPADAAASKSQRTFARHARFAGTLAHSFAVGDGWHEWLQDDTIVCRCEAVPYARVRDAVASGARDVRAVKALTRCGMGLCQGRICGYAVAQITARESGRDASEVGEFRRTGFAMPVPLGAIARSP